MINLLCFRINMLCIKKKKIGQNMSRGSKCFEWGAGKYEKKVSLRDQNRIFKFEIPKSYNYKTWEL